MFRYFYLQLKRVFRVLPYLLLSLAVLVSAGCFALSRLNSQDQSQEDTRLKVAICGDVDHPFFEIGLNTVQAIDGIRHTLHLQVMDEDEAVDALDAGQIDAYVIIPPAFMNNALQGDLEPMKYISSSGAVGITALLRDEITKAISTIVVVSQTAMLAFENLSSSYDVIKELGIRYTDLSVTILEYVLSRTSFYSVDDLDISDPLGLEGYLTSGIFVLLIGMLLLPFGYLFIKKDLSLERLMTSKGNNVFAQGFCEYISLFAGQLVTVFALVGFLLVGLRIASVNINGLFPLFSYSMLWKLVPIVFTITAFGYFVFTASDSLVGGLLLYFFLQLILCFVSGCMYPLSYFPAGVQNVGALLPFAFARQVASQILVDEARIANVLPLLVWGACFIVGSLFLRASSVKKGRR